MPDHFDPYLDHDVGEGRSHRVTGRHAENAVAQQRGRLAQRTEHPHGQNMQDISERARHTVIGMRHVAEKSLLHDARI